MGPRDVLYEHRISFFVFHQGRPSVIGGGIQLTDCGWHSTDGGCWPTDGGWPMTDSSYSRAGALRRSEGTGGRQPFFPVLRTALHGTRQGIPIARA